MSDENATEEKPSINITLVGEPVQPEPQEEEEVIDNDEVSLVGEFKGVVETTERLIRRAGSDDFLKLLQKSFAAQTAKELKANVYQIIKDVSIRGGMVAQAFEDLEEDFIDLKDEVAAQGRLLRDLVSTSIMSLAWNLSRLCLERVQDPEIRNLAQTIYSAVTPTTGQAITRPSNGAGEATESTPSTQSPNTGEVP